MKSESTVYKSSLEFLKDILKDVFKSENVKVVLFGSRARGDYFETSDMDIGILPKGETNKNKVALLREKIENSNIPYKVDVVDLSQASREFTDQALKEGLVIWKG